MKCLGTFLSEGGNRMGNCECTKCGRTFKDRKTAIELRGHDRNLVCYPIIDFSAQLRESQRRFEESQRRFQEQLRESQRRFEESQRRFQDQLRESQRRWEESQRRW